MRWFSQPTHTHTNPSAGWFGAMENTSNVGTSEDDSAPPPHAKQRQKPPCTSAQVQVGKLSLFKSIASLEKYMGFCILELTPLSRLLERGTNKNSEINCLGSPISTDMVRSLQERVQGSFFHAKESRDCWHGSLRL